MATISIFVKDGNAVMDPHRGLYWVTRTITPKELEKADKMARTFPYRVPLIQLGYAETMEEASNLSEKEKSRLTSEGHEVSIQWQVRRIK